MPPDLRPQNPTGPAARAPHDTAPVPGLHGLHELSHDRLAGSRPPPARRPLPPRQSTGERSSRWTSFSHEVFT
eukprot:scaffold14896_cov111-Isochrysis_galbana.AAC.13